MGNRLPSSFRDPGGYIFEEHGKLFRHINKSCLEDFLFFMDSGLYDRLAAERKIVKHEQVFSDENHIIIEPEKIPFITYPYEWSLSQYKDAALLTLELAAVALEYDMILKDASAYNIQFNEGHPVLIDTLSFTRYKEGTPWVAYRQFCQHFLAPIALMALKDPRLSQMMRVYIDGVPLDLASKLLPAKTKFDFGLQLHIHQHARQQLKHASDSGNITKNIKISKASLIAILDHLRSTIKKLNKRSGTTQWVSYYQNMHNYSEEAFSEKINIVRQFLRQTNARLVCDMGANVGVFSAIASENAKLVVAYDIDHDAVDVHYNSLKRSGIHNVVPAVLDIANPSPAIGWALRERMSTFERGNFDCVMALAIIHHICISGNVPLDMAAETFATLGKWLIIEFVPKSDSQVKKLLSTREDIFSEYNERGFEDAFSQKFEIISKSVVTGNERAIYLMR
ncbi:MAG: SAM-dependent methyltransferase, partial [Firmicutes bacterium]|nr:SAM-dependent methyltransferase [Bacillota bacterium]